MLVYLQDLKGKVLIKAKRLNKLEAVFFPETATADDPDVTEEEESDDEDDQEEKKSKVGVVSRESE